MSAKIEYNGATVATISAGKVATLPVKDRKMATELKVKVEKDTPTLQNKTVTPTKATQPITADSGYDGLSKVTVNPIPSNYIVPSGTVDLSENRVYDVTRYAKASISVPIPDGYINPSGTKNITENGTHDVNAFESAYVNVRPPLQSKTVTPTKSSQPVSADAGYYGLSQVTVNPIPSNYIVPSGTVNIVENKTVDVTQYASATINVPIPSGYIKPSGTKSITENGTHNVNEFANATVNVRPPLQTKTVTPARNSQVIAPDDNYYGLSEVTVNPIPSEYIVPSGTKNITENGTHNVNEYASAFVNVPEVPEYSKVAGFNVFLDEFDEGTCTVGYTAPQDVKLPKGTHRLASVDFGGEAPSSPSIETGTLTLYDGNGYNFEIIYPQYRADGSIISVQETYHGDGDGDAVFNNIPLGTPVVMYFPGRDGIDDGDLQGLSEINFSSYLPSCRVFKLTASTAAAYFL